MRKAVRAIGLILDGIGLFIAGDVSSPDAISHMKIGAVLVGIGSLFVLSTYAPLLLGRQTARRGGRS